MSLVWRKRVKLSPNATLNVSRRGAGVAWRWGPFTLSTRGRLSIRILPGLSWRSKL